MSRDGMLSNAFSEHRMFSAGWTCRRNGTDAKYKLCTKMLGRMFHGNGYRLDNDDWLYLSDNKDDNHQILSHLTSERIRLIKNRHGREIS
jgi:hypothetical protein